MADDDDPSAFVLSEPWNDKEARLRKASPYGGLLNWRLMSMIVKTGEDMRQELLAFQLLTTLEEIWSEEQVDVYLRPYKILVCSNDMGLIEPIPNACSLHQVSIRRDNSLYIFACSDQKEPDDGSDARRRLSAVSGDVVESLFD